MFAKLLKHEWKATGKMLGIFSLAALGVGVIAAVVLRLIVNYSSNVADERVLLMLVPVLSMLLVFLVLALMAYTVLTQFMLLRRFYKNKFTDEGYLTFTLPVNAHQIFLSSWMNMLIWTVISVAVIGVAVFVILAVGSSGEVFREFPAMWEDISFIFQLYYREYGWGYPVLLVIYQVVAFLTSPVILMSCITIGAVAAKKHKILMAVAIYYIYSMAVSMGSSVVETMSLLSAYRSDSNAAVYITLAGQLILNLAVSITGYFLSTHFMKNKLNLP